MLRQDGSIPSDRTLTNIKYFSITKKKKKILNTKVKEKALLSLHKIPKTHPLFRDLPSSLLQELIKDKSGQVLCNDKWHFDASSDNLNLNNLDAIFLRSCLEAEVVADAHALSKRFRQGRNTKDQDHHLSDDCWRLTHAPITGHLSFALRSSILTPSNFKKWLFCYSIDSLYSRYFDLEHKLYLLTGKALSTNYPITYDYSVLRSKFYISHFPFLHSNQKPKQVQQTTTSDVFNPSFFFFKTCFNQKPTVYDAVSQNAKLGVSNQTTEFQSGIPESLFDFFLTEKFNLKLNYGFTPNDGVFSLYQVYKKYHPDQNFQPNRCIYTYFFSKLLSLSISESQANRPNVLDSSEKLYFVRDSSFKIQRPVLPKLLLSVVCWWAWSLFLPNVTTLGMCQSCVTPYVICSCPNGSLNLRERADQHNYTLLQFLKKENFSFFKYFIIFLKKLKKMKTFKKNIKLSPFFFNFVNKSTSSVINQSFKPLTLGRIDFFKFKKKITPQRLDSFMYEKHIYSYKKKKWLDLEGLNSGFFPSSVFGTSEDSVKNTRKNLLNLLKTFNRDNGANVWPFAVTEKKNLNANKDILIHLKASVYSNRPVVLGAANKRKTKITQHPHCYAWKIWNYEIQNRIWHYKHKIPAKILYSIEFFLRKARPTKQNLFFLKKDKTSSRCRRYTVFKKNKNLRKKLPLPWVLSSLRVLKHQPQYETLKIRDARFDQFLRSLKNIRKYPEMFGTYNSVWPESWPFNRFTKRRGALARLWWYEYIDEFKDFLDRRKYGIENPALLPLTLPQLGLLPFSTIYKKLKITKLIYFFKHKSYVELPITVNIFDRQLKYLWSDKALNYFEVVSVRKFFFSKRKTRPYFKTLKLNHRARFFVSTNAKFMTYKNVQIPRYSYLKQIYLQKNFNRKKTFLRAVYDEVASLNEFYRKKEFYMTSISKLFNQNRKDLFATSLAFVHYQSKENITKNLPSATVEAVNNGEIKPLEVGFKEYISPALKKKMNLLRSLETQYVRLVEIQNANFQRKVLAMLSEFEEKKDIPFIGRIFFKDEQWERLFLDIKNDKEQGVDFSSFLM